MTELVDPQLEAFFATNPEILQPQAFDATSPKVPAWYDNTVIELAGAIIAVRGLVALSLARREAPPPVGQAQAIAGQAWRHHAPTWAKFSVPAIKQAYRAGRVRGMSAADIEAMAADYADGLGGYLADTSGEALAEGYEMQLAQRWDSGLAWHRVTAAYGLDKPDMRSYIRTVLAQPPESRDAVGTAGKMLADRLMLARAQRVAENEAWTASQSGLATSWIVRQRRGEISPDAVRRWRTRRGETVCAVCGPMDGAVVPLDQPFTLPDGTKLLAPGAHPGCQCTQELVEPLSKSKKLDDGTLDPYDRTKKGRFARREERTRVVTHLADPILLTPEAQAIVDQVKQGVRDPFATRTEDPFGVQDAFARAGDPFAAAGGDPFASTDPFATKAKDPFAGPDPFDNEKATSRIAAPKRRIVIHHIFMPKKSTEAKDDFDISGDSHHIPRSEWESAFEEWDSGTLVQPGDQYNFTELAAEKANHARFDPSNSPEVQALIEDAVPKDDPRFEERVAADKMSPELVDVYAPIAVRTDDPWQMIPDIDDRSSDDYDMDPQQAWPEIRTMAKAIFDDVLNDPRRHVEKLDRHQIDTIYDMAGYDRNEDDSIAKDRIIDHVQARGMGDDSLSEAFGDYVTWNSLKSTGEAGEDLRYALDNAVDAGLPNVRQEFGPKSQALFETFAFESGFHPETSVYSRGERANVHDNYLVNHVVYRSALGEAKTMPFVTGLRELYMRPADAAGHPLYGGPYAEH